MYGTGGWSFSTAGEIFKYNAYWSPRHMAVKLHVKQGNAKKTLVFTTCSLTSLFSTVVINIPLTSTIFNHISATYSDISAQYFNIRIFIQTSAQDFSFPILIHPAA